MALITIKIPSLLEQLLNSNEPMTIEADSLDTVFSAIEENEPRLAVHLFDESGQLRPHVLCFVNDVNTRWLDDRSIQLKDGDTLLIMQAVSGG